MCIRDSEISITSKLHDKVALIEGEYQLINSQLEQTVSQSHTYKKNTSLCGARLDMTKIRTRKFSIVCIVNIREYADFAPQDFGVSKTRRPKH